MKSVKLSTQTITKKYSQFDQINGSHPLKEQVPQAYVEYQVRSKKGGRVHFFNFDLAQEMGVLEANHPLELDQDLVAKILETFSLQIINEWDIAYQTKIHPEEIKPQTYMATRYLQLQHPGKKGKTSGDGRSIWNGVFQGKKGLWDISSCGTGSTKLSPAVNIYKRFFKTGDPFISYGCGCSEVTEGIETLFFSEALARNQLKTERVLAIIEYDKGLAITVRAYPNLIRPSHFFCHLKQNNYLALKSLLDYYIQREQINGNYPKELEESKKYGHFLKRVSENFARTAATFEDEYIFCWLDWDGDNILMDGGIIDYGSIRQFGLFHSEYRYDDVERFSTTLTEQKKKARYIVQCFIQLVDYLESGKKKNLSHFKNHPLLQNFESSFQDQKRKNLLRKFGFSETLQSQLPLLHSKELDRFASIFYYFESAKSSRGSYKVADGITRDAIHSMRDVLRELPQLYLARGKKIEPQEFNQIIRSSYAKKVDIELTAQRLKKIDEFQECYWGLLAKVSALTNKSRDKILLEVTMRSSVINKYDRVTGDSITHMTHKIAKARPKLSPIELVHLSRAFSDYQTLDPQKSVNEEILLERAKDQTKLSLLEGLMAIVRECREGL
jgi:uncharacterized protein YdiU (UPF0061 family)